jgi:hypothetical protein
MAISVDYEDSEGRIGSVGSLVVTHMRESTTLGFLKEFEKVQNKLIERHPKISCISVLSQAAMKLDTQANAYSVELTDRFAPHFVGTGLVVTTRGLGGVSVRTALSMYFMVAKGHTPTRVFSTTHEALSWLQGLVGQTADLKSVSTSELDAFFQAPTFKGPGRP